MFESLGASASEERWTHWQQRSQHALKSRLGVDMCAFVAEDPSNPRHLVACGAGVILVRLPNPWHPEGLVGYVQWMSTEPTFRRQGLARAILDDILGWFEERAVDNVELHATSEGEPLYRQSGFWEGTGGKPMRRRPWDPPPAS